MTFLQTTTSLNLLIPGYLSPGNGGGYPPGWKANLLVHPTGQETTIHHQDLARDKSRSIASQEDRRPNQLHRLAEPPHLCPHQQLLAAVALVEQLLAQRRPKHSLRNRI